MKKVQHILIVAALIAISFALPKLTFSFDIPTVLTLVSLVFVILIGFFFAAATSNYQRLQTLISGANAGLISLFSLTKEIQPEAKERMAEVIDKYMISVLDYDLLNYVPKTFVEFDRVCAEIDKLNPADGKGVEILGFVQEKKEEVRQFLEELSLVSKPVINFEHWLVINVFAVIIGILMLALRDGSLASSCITAVVLVSIYLVLDLLHSVDTNRFLAKKLEFQTPQMVFTEMGRLPYYPAYAIEAKLVRDLPKTYRRGKKNKDGTRVIEVVG